MSKTYVAAKPMSNSALAATLALAIAVGLEATTVYAFSHGSSQASVVAMADGSTLYVAAPVRMKMPKVEVSIVAQADAPAR